MTYLALSHYLVAVDFLVALTLAARRRSITVVVESEWQLWRNVARAKEHRQLHPGYLVSDGAVTLSDPQTSERSTFHLEVVRAGTKSGNQSLLKKLRRYVELNREGYFRRVFTHERLRAVIILTTTTRRAERFRELAKDLPHGQQLFWFGSYLERDQLGRDVSSLSQESLVAARFADTAGTLHSIIPSDPTVPSEGRGGS